MTQVTDAELVAIADMLYDESCDDDIRLAQLMMQLDSDVALQLATSDLTNAAQVYIYAFMEVPREEIYDILLLEPSPQILRGIKLETVELAEIVMGFDKRKQKFFIGVWFGDAFVAAFTGRGAYDHAVSYALENCSE